MAENKKREGHPRPPLRGAARKRSAAGAGVTKTPLEGGRPRAKRSGATWARG